jgi:hypothetical protein
VQTSTSPQAVQQPGPPTGWKTYINKQFGFQFQYPESGRITEYGPSQSQSGTQPDNLGTIQEFEGSSRQILILVFNPDIVKGDNEWPERPCGEWSFGPDDSPLSSDEMSFAGQKTLRVVSRGSGSKGSLTTTHNYCVNYRRNPVVISFEQPPSSETQHILSSFRFDS